jgi:hypothetical protein
VPASAAAVFGGGMPGEECTTCTCRCETCCRLEAQRSPGAVSGCASGGHKRIRRRHLPARRSPRLCLRPSALQSPHRRPRCLRQSRLTCPWNGRDALGAVPHTPETALRSSVVELSARCICSHTMELDIRTLRLARTDLPPELRCRAPSAVLGKSLACPGLQQERSSRLRSPRPRCTRSLSRASEPIRSRPERQRPQTQQQSNPSAVSVSYRELFLRPAVGS